MKKVLRHLTLKSLTTALVLMIAAVAVPCHASEKDDKAELIEALNQMSNAQIMQSVPIGKYAEMIQKFQHKEALHLMNIKSGNTELYNRKDNCKVETMRHKEIVVLTIPTDLLFLPNETSLMRNANHYLNPLKRYLKIPDMYRVLIVVHTDNTGSESYTDKLSIDRADALYDWFANEGCDTSFLFPSGSGAIEPLMPNISGENRAKNRRVEIYLVPGEEMMRQARKGRIAL